MSNKNVLKINTKRKEKRKQIGIKSVAECTKYDHENRVNSFTFTSFSILFIKCEKNVDKYGLLS